MKAAILFMILLLPLNSLSSDFDHPPHIQKLVNLNTADSLFEAAVNYVNDETVSTDIVKAYELLYVSADKGNYHADYWMIILREEFEEKIFIDPKEFNISRRRAIDGYEHLLKKHPDDPEAYYRLSVLLDPGVGLESMEPRSRKYLEVAAQKGHKKAINLLEILKESERKSTN